MITYICLDYFLPPMEGFNGWEKFVQTIFQATNTRYTGFTVVDLSTVNPPQNFAYVIYMVVSAYPLISTVHNTALTSNTKTIFHFFDSDLSTHDALEEYSQISPPKKRAFFGVTLHQIILPIFNDTLWLILAVFLISCIESKSLRTDPNYSEFKVS